MRIFPLMSRRTLFGLFVVLLGLSLLKHVCLSRFCHPMADDWSYAHRSLTHPLWQCLWSDHLNWNGRYFSNILVSSGPLVLGLDALWLYRLVPVLLMFLTIIAYRALMHSVTEGVLRPGEQWGGALVLFALYIQGMPDIGEGFYWYTGAITYQVGSVLMMFLVARIIRPPVHERTTVRWLSLVINAVLILAVMGSSEVHMALLFAFYGVVLLMRWRLGAAHRRGELVPLLLVIICAVVVVFAPGNAVRGALFEGAHDPLRSVCMSALQTIRFAGTWASNPALLLLSVLYLPIGRALARRSPRCAAAFRMRPWMSTVALFAVIFLCVLPAYWGTGILGQHRTVNVAYGFFLPVWFINLTVWDVRVVQRYWPTVSMPSAAAVPIILLATIVFINVDRNGGRANQDLLTGRAARFDVQMHLRYTRLAQVRPVSGPVVLPTMADPPRSLCFMELRDDPADWMNRCYANYFGLEGRSIVRGAAP